MSNPHRSGRIPRPTASSGLHRLPTDATANRPTSANYNLEHQPMSSGRTQEESTFLSHFSTIFASHRISAGLLMLLVIGLVSVMLLLLAEPLNNAFTQWTQRGR